MKHFYYLLSMVLLVFTSSEIHTQNPIGGGEENAKSIDLELNYTAAAAEYSIFTNHLFILTLTNNGTDNATGVQVYAPFSSSILAYTDSEVSHGDYSVWTGFWEVGELASGESVTLNLTLFVLNVSGEVGLFAQVQAANEEDIDSTPGNNITQIPMEDDEAIITVTQLGSDGGGSNNGNQKVDIELNMTTNHTEVNVGSQFSYILSASNKGENSATGVKVYFPMPPQVEYVGSNNDQTTYDPISGEWNIGNIAANATRSILIDVEVKIGGGILAVAEVLTVNETDVDSTPNNGIEDEDDFFSLETLGLQIDLELRMELPSNSSNFVPIGGEVTFLVHVENKGPTVGYNSKIRAILPEGLDYLRNGVSMGEYLEDLGVWVIGDIPAFEIQTMELTTRVIIGEPLTFTCEARTSNVPDVDSTPSNFDPNEDDIDSITIFPTVIDTDIEMAKDLVNFLLYPIPSNDILHLQFPSSSSTTEMTLTLHDLNGKILYQKEIQSIMKTNYWEIDIASFPSGVYLLSMKTAGDYFTKKIVKP